MEAKRVFAADVETKDEAERSCTGDMELDSQIKRDRAKDPDEESVICSFNILKTDFE